MEVLLFKNMERNCENSFLVEVINLLNFLEKMVEEKEVELEYMKYKLWQFFLVSPTYISTKPFITSLGRTFFHSNPPPNINYDKINSGPIYCFVPMDDAGKTLDGSN